MISDCTRRAQHDADVVTICHGRGILKDLDSRLDRLHELVSTPITSRRVWLQTWIDCYRDYDLWCVAVERDGELVAFAGFGRVRTMGITHHVVLGHGPSDVVEFSAVDEPAAIALVDGINRGFAESRHWTFTGRGLDGRSLLIPIMGEHLPNAQICDTDVLPAMSFTVGRDLRAYVSRNHHQQVRRLENKAIRDGLDIEVRHVSGTDLEASIESLVAIQRLRELDAGRRVKTEDERDGRFLREVIANHVAQKEVEASILSVDGRPGAFTVTFIDGDVRRLWTLGFDPTYREYGIGRLCVDASIRRALADPSCTAYDFMKGDEQYKRTFANQTVETVELWAWSSAALRAPYEAGRRVREGIKRRAESDERIRSVVDAGKRARSAWWHRSAGTTGDGRA